MDKITKAKYKPRPEIEISNRLKESRCVDSQYFDFIFAFILDDGLRFWEPVDIAFPGSDPINERDLEFKKGVKRCQKI